MCVQVFPILLVDTHWSQCCVISCEHSTENWEHTVRLRSNHILFYTLFLILSIPAMIWGWLLSKCNNIIVCELLELASYRNFKVWEKSYPGMPGKECLDFLIHVVTLVTKWLLLLLRNYVSLVVSTIITILQLPQLSSILSPVLISPNLCYTANNNDDDVLQPTYTYM